MNGFFGDLPADRGYQNILVYDGQNNQPVVKLLRHISNYIDGGKGFQDEVEVADTAKLPEDLKGHRWQVNFETDADGNLVKYPTSPQLSDYMKVAIDEISQASTKAGAEIRVNYTTRYVSDGKQWNTPQPNRPKPELPKPPRQLPQG
jgi:hypothetical protein